MSDRSLRVFVTAARFGSFTAAGKELGIGQPAVSYAVHRLEEALGGTQLLVRSRTGVQLTQAGQALLDGAGSAFDQIDAAVRNITSADNSTVNLSVSTSLASWWLLPRLPDFKRQNPDVSLRLVTADTDEGVDMKMLDLWIPLGSIDRSDLRSTMLCREALIPVASPALAATLGRSPSDLLAAPLLHLEERYSPRFDWSHWFASHHVDTPTSLPGDRSTDYSLVVQSALDGQGVALGWEHIVRDLLASGRLVALGSPIITEQPFVVLSDARRPLTVRRNRSSAVAYRPTGERTNLN